MRPEGGGGGGPVKGPVKGPLWGPGGGASLSPLGGPPTL